MANGERAREGLFFITHEAGPSVTPCGPTVGKVGGSQQGKAAGRSLGGAAKPLLFVYPHGGARGRLTEEQPLERLCSCEATLVGSEK